MRFFRVMRTSRIPLISRRAVAFVASLALALPCFLSAADLSVEKVSDGVEIRIDGQLFTKYITGDGETNKPYFYPIIGPTGKEMTRAYPMRDVEGEAKDHPHQRSMWFGHQEVGDSDTWHELKTLVERAKGDAAKLAELKKSLGATKTRDVLEAKAEGDHAVLRVASDYLDARGDRMAEDVRTFTFRVAPDGSRIIDVDFTVTGVIDEIVFHDAKDAGFSLRVAHPMAGKSGRAGRVVMSTGEEGDDAWGKRANWCDFNGPVDETDEILGIAVLDHPTSLRHPAPWHARTYGLFTANPFGMKSVGGAEKEEPVVLKKGESFRLRYRVIFHKGDEKTANIADAWKAFEAEK